MPEETERDHERHLELPAGTAVFRNPEEHELRETVGFPEESELLESHGRHFQLIEGRNRTILEVRHFVERRHRLLDTPEVEEETIVYVLPVGTSLLEARRIGYRLLERVRNDEQETLVASQSNPTRTERQCRNDRNHG